MNRLVLLITAIVILTGIVLVFVLSAGYFGRDLFWPGQGPAADGAGRGATQTQPVSIPPHAVPPPIPEGLVIRGAEVKGEVVTEPPVDTLARTRYVIQPNDTLSSIAVRHYGDISYIQDILRENPGLDENLIIAGKELTLPPRREEAGAATADDQPKVHVVRPGETLIRIAQWWYGDAAMYIKIYEANQDQLSSPNAILRAGTRLRLPPRPKYD